jgi:hypothetical protein
MPQRRPRNLSRLVDRLALPVLAVLLFLLPPFARRAPVLAYDNPHLPVHPRGPGPVFDWGGDVDAAESWFFSQGPDPFRAHVNVRLFNLRLIYATNRHQTQWLAALPVWSLALPLVPLPLAAVVARASTRPTRARRAARARLLRPVSRRHPLSACFVHFTLAAALAAELQMLEFYGWGGDTLYKLLFPAQTPFRSIGFTRAGLLLYWTVAAVPFFLAAAAVAAVVATHPARFPGSLLAATAGLTLGPFLFAIVEGLSPDDAWSFIPLPSRGLPLLVLLPLAFTLHHRRARTRPRFPSALCPHCAYNLTGNTSGTCPECGTPVQQSSNHTKAPSSK